MKIKALVLTGAIVASGAAYAQAATTADRAFVAKVSQGGMFEVSAGRLSETSGSTQDVRDFATAEVHDHSLVGDKLKRISDSGGIAIAPALNAEFLGKMKHLSSLSGGAFDAAYLSEVATLHDADGAASLRNRKMAEARPFAASPPKPTVSCCGTSAQSKLSRSTERDWLTERQEVAPRA